jgi:hypothetical protein
MFARPLLNEFDNLTLQQGSHARMQFGILLLQQGNSLAAACMQFGILPLQQGNSLAAACMQFGILPGSLVSWTAARR